MGIFYLLYLALQAINPKNQGIFEARTDLKKDRPAQLFSMGFLTSVLNPKIAVFYLSFFPQFLKTEYSSIFFQSLQLGIIQTCVSFSINFLIVLFAARMSSWFTQHPFWVKIQKWFMASILSELALRMVLDKNKY